MRFIYIVRRSERQKKYCIDILIDFFHVIVTYNTNEIIITMHLLTSAQR